jgi:hypothetical protein
MTERKFTPFVDDGTVTKYVTRRGAEARVSISSKPLNYGCTVIKGFVKRPDGEWAPTGWQIDGTCSHTAYDLFDIPVKHTRWVNVYPSGVFYSINTSFPTKEAADSYAAKHRVACIEVTFEEGEGL